MVFLVASFSTQKPYQLQMRSLVTSIVVTAFLLGITPNSISRAFPEEVIDAQFQFIQDGDINIGAILSIRGKYRGHMTKKMRSVLAGNGDYEKNAKRERTKQGDNTLIGKQTAVKEIFVHSVNNNTAISNKKEGDTFPYDENAPQNISPASNRNGGNPTTGSHPSSKDDLSKHPQSMGAHQPDNPPPGIGVGGQGPPSMGGPHSSGGPRNAPLCSPWIANFQSLENFVAVLFALDEINARTDLLPNITIGVTILDDCFSPSLALARAIQFMPGAQKIHQLSGTESHLPRRLRRQQHRQQQPRQHHEQLHKSQHFKKSSLRSPRRLKNRKNTKPENMQHFSEFEAEGAPANNFEADSNSGKDNASVLSTKVSALKTFLTQPTPFSLTQSKLTSKPVSASLAQHAASSLSKSTYNTSAMYSNTTTKQDNDEDDNKTNYKNRGPQLPAFYDVMGVVGAYTSATTLAVADVMSIFGLPQISHGATTDVLSDKKRFPYFFRTIPADYYQIQSMADLLRHFNWSYVSIIFSDDPYGTHAQKHLKTLLQDFQICVAQSIELRDNMEDAEYNDVITRLRSHDNARVVVLYADIRHIGPLISAVRRLNAFQEFIWAGSDTTRLASEMEGGHCGDMLGSFSLAMKTTAPPNFSEYMHRFLLEHTRVLEQFFKEDREQIHALFPEISDVVWRNKEFLSLNTSFPSSRSKSKSKPQTNGYSPLFKNMDTADKYSPTFTVSYAVDAVLAFAHAIDDLIQLECLGETTKHGIIRCVRGRSVVPYLETVKFPGTSGDVFFDKHGDVSGRIDLRQCQLGKGRPRLVSVATWDTSEGLQFHADLQWPRDTESTPRSVCADSCAPNEIYVFPRQTCCWSCVPCKANEVTTRNKTQCNQCPDLFWPDQDNHVSCLRIEPSAVPMQDPLPLCLVLAAAVGLVTSSLTAALFYIHRKHRVIRASSRELSYVMLVGVVCALCLVPSLLAPPKLITCYINLVGFSLTFTLIYSPMFVKTVRIYRIFTTSLKSAALPKRTSSAWQMLFAFIFILIQTIVVSASLSTSPPRVQPSQQDKSVDHVIEFCDLPLGGFLPPLAFNVSLVVACTFYAFKTRHLPDNFNESRYIAFCADTTLLVWTTFVPTYFAVTRPFYRVVILALALLINSFVCLLLMFAPKLYALRAASKRGASGESAGKAAQARHHRMQDMTMARVIRSAPSFFQEENTTVGIEEKIVPMSNTTDTHSE